MGETDAFEAYRLQVLLPDGDAGPKLIIERDAGMLREALIGFWEELCHAGRDHPPDVPEDGITLDIMPVVLTGQEWLQAAEFEWEGFRNV